ncbi:MAG TPA: ATP-binding protein [Methylophilaceae bacterium]|nr:ATP-binding protein [Methylophilaceae bacterium]
MYPKSFLKLLLFGFALAMLPLLFAFGNAAVYVDQLAEQSRSTVAQAVQATRSSRVLVEQLNLMERSARQYFVLRESLLLDNYALAHEKFTFSINELAALPLSQEQRSALSSLSKEETELFGELKNKGLETTDTESGDTENNLPSTAITRFRDLSIQAQNILAENNRLIDRESASLAENAERTQKVLFWQTLTLVPVGLFVAMVITYLVARPIRRMDEAIKHLGEGNYDDPISIDGPGDMRILGERLDWLRSQLQAVEQEKQRFLRHISHELKTPLTAIRQGSELLSDEVGGTLSPQQKEIAGILRESSLRLQKMIENLLHYTAVQFKKPQLRLSNVLLSELMQKILSSYALTLDSKKVEIQSTLQAIHLICDEDKVHTVIDNLISNAIKYTPQSGIINLRIYRQHENAIIEIYDNGPGVMASDKARLFDPFYRGSAVYESLVSGSGLGLSIAKEYVDAHGGEISLIPSDFGAHFRVRLPFVSSKRDENAHE